MAETKISLRIPDPLYERVKAAAEAERRSAHAEILILIEYALDAREGHGTDAS